MYEIIENNDLQLKFNNQLFEYFIDNTRSFSNKLTTLIYEHNLQQTIMDNTQMIFYKELCTLVNLVSIEKNLQSQLFYSFLKSYHSTLKLFYLKRFKLFLLKSLLLKPVEKR